MSYHQPCLPVPKSKKRQRDDRSGENRNTKTLGGRTKIDGDQQDDDDGSDFDDQINGVSLDKISTMDAATYMSLVAKEARRFPLVSACKITKNDENGRRSGAFSKPRIHTSSSRDSPQEAGKTPSPSSTTPNATDSNSGTKSTSSDSADVRHQQKTRSSVGAPIAGAAASLEYLTSHRASLTPVPSPWHLPASIQQQQQHRISSASSATATAAAGSNATPKTWVDVTLTNFDRLRQYLQKCQTKGIGGKHDSSRQAVPPMKDEQGWWSFCLGYSYDDVVGVIQGGAHSTVPDTSDKTEDNIDEDRNEGCVGDGTEGSEASLPNELINSDQEIEVIVSWKRKVPINGYQPSVRLMLQMDQVMIRKVVSHISAYIAIMTEDAVQKMGVNKNSMQQDVAVCRRDGELRAFEWLYALLARLETPIHRDDAAVLYTLLKDLTKLRACVRVSPQHPNEQDDKYGDDDDDYKGNDMSTKLTAAATDGSDDSNFLAQLNTVITVIGIYFDQGGDKVMKLTS